MRKEDIMRKIAPLIFAGASLLFFSTVPVQAVHAQGEVVITCQRCQASPTDVFSQSRYEVVQAFNKAYRGKYRVDVQMFGGKNENDLTYWERLALAGSLPDVFVAQSTQLQTLAKTGKLLNLAPFLAKDPKWKDSFYPDSFESLSGADGQIWGIAEERDVVGIFYNKALFAKAGVRRFPVTWDEFLSDCQKLKDHGIIPFAMDGDWVTQLMWANLIGTQPGGEQFLFSGIAKGGFADNPIVVKATEFLKKLHTEGYVNQDAFTGDYPNAANPFLQGQAAMIANGPWMVQADIKGKSAMPGLYAHIGYAPSPGWTADGRGVIVLAGNAGWASGSTDPAKEEAAVAFMKFTTSPAIQLERTIATGAYWAVKLRLSPAQIRRLEPLTYALVREAESVKYHYPHAKFATPQAFTDAWKNYWPGYVQGAMSTTDFLTKLSAALTTSGQ
jgi:ABC-type glycerol-3-phosphate transport system substrate-binding protein